MLRKLLIATTFLICVSQLSAQISVTLYEDCNYSGRYYYLEPGNYRLYQMKIGNDLLSSLNIPYGMKVTIYEDDNFAGRSKTYSSSTSCLDGQWNDMASSIVIEKTVQYNPNDYVVFFTDCYSKGTSQTLRPGQYSGNDLGNLKNNISSFTIYGNIRVKAYINNDNLSGYSYTHTNSESCLSKAENDKISSLIVEYVPYNNNGNNNNGYNNGYNNNNGNGNNSYATIFTDCNYKGNSIRLAPGYYQGDKLGLFKYDISSIELPSNLRAKVFVNNEFLDGTSYILTGNTNCLNYSLNNRIGSLVIEETNNNGYNNYNNGYQPNEYQVIIYTDTEYKGQSVSLLPGMYSTMSQVNFPDDALSSLVVPQGYRVVIYEDQNFRGKSYTITASKNKFYMSGWNDKTSSIAVYRDR
jgi:hypothetical protein